MTGIPAKALAAAGALAVLLSMRAYAEDAPPPPLTGSLGAGVAVTSGNSDTKNWNLSLGVVYDPKTNSIFKADALYLRGENNGEDTLDRKAAGLRYDHKLTDRLSAYGEVRYLSDKFKGVDSLVSPAVGLSYLVVKTDAVSLAFDAGYGWYWERLDGFDRTDGGAYRAGEAFSWKISETAALTQNLTAMWKANDTEEGVANAIYHAEISLATALTPQSQLKIGVVSDYRNEVIAPLKKNDVSTVAALVVKF
jgi:putative salt-induced outer membrane protein YdiY